VLSTKRRHQFPDSNTTDLLQNQHPKTLTKIGGGVRKNWLLTYIRSNISEMGQEGTKVTTGDQYVLSNGAKINDLGLS